MRGGGRVAVRSSATGEDATDAWLPLLACSDSGWNNG